MKLLLTFTLTLALFHVSTANFNHVSSGVWHPEPTQVASWLGIDVQQSNLHSSTIGIVGRALLEKITDFTGSLLKTHTPKPNNDGAEYPYFRFVPAFEASAVPDRSTVSWSAPCFKNSSASVAANADGTYTLTVNLANPTSFLCSDFYLFATVEGVMLHTFFMQGSHTFKWTPAVNASKSELWDIQTKGIRIFRFVDNAINTIGYVLDTALLFAPLTTKLPSADATKRNLDFMAKYPQFAMSPRTVQEVPLDASQIHSGDFFGILRLDGLDPMLAWAMGSVTGHTTVALWSEDKQLYVCETTNKNSYWPTNGVQCTLYSTWIQQARDAGFQLVHAPLTPEARAQFNATAAWEFYHTVAGNDYGYHTLLWGWIDTLKDNYPCLPPNYDICLQYEHVEILFGLMDRFVPAVGDILFNEAYNNRLNTTGLKAADLYYQASLKGIPSETIPTLIESDSFTYHMQHNNGSVVVTKSQVCCVFVCNIWKAGGLFKNFNNELNCGELTNFDDYTLNLLDTPARPSQCVAADPNNQLCQLEGAYTLNLNKYAQTTPYSHMAERCPSLAPHYDHPAGC